MTMTDRIKIMLIKRGGISMAELARKMGESPQNLNNKMKRNKFTEHELRNIADVLGCDMEIVFTARDTGEVM